MTCIHHYYIKPEFHCPKNPFCSAYLSFSPRPHLQNTCSHLGERVVKNPPANTGDESDTGVLPGVGRSPGEGHGKPLQYSCLDNPMDRGAWQAIVHGVTKSQAQL